ncbi:unnamed protein product, partial [Phaeothamnion confervicola]
AGLKVSGEKFAWLVHIMAVSLASLSPVSSWAGLQIGYTQAVLDGLAQQDPGGDGGGGGGRDGFVTVLATLPYRFFPLLYLGLLLAVVLSGRDLGPMGASEEAATATNGGATASTKMASGAAAEAAETVGTAQQPAPALGPLDPRPDTPLRAYNALVPFSVVVAVTVGGMLLDGRSKLLA